MTPSAPGTPLHVDDDGFVRAPVRVVYPALTNLAGWPTWWPGMHVTRMTGVVRDGKPRERYALDLRGRLPGRGFRLEAVPHAYRHDAGFVLDLTGDLVGTAEFWLETLDTGTVVHHVLAAHTTARRPLSVLAAYRQHVRRGLWGVKDDLQSRVRREAGLPA